MTLQALIEKEGWTIGVGKDGHQTITAYGQIFPFTHPAVIYLKLFKDEKNPELKYQFMKSAHDHLWGDRGWNYWTERRFRAFCAGYNYITWCGGANIGKSYDCAKIAILFWLCNPKHRGVIVASTTLDSASARIWGYVTKLLSCTKVKFNFKYLADKPPKILYPVSKADKDTQIKDTLHGVFCVAAKLGSDADSIANWIGRHPDDSLLLILDEAPDLNPAIAKSFINLDSSTKPFCCIAIGNSKDRFDLHGSMSTPKNTWSSVNPYTDFQWETTQKNGIAQLFQCYDSPAIFEKDPEKKKILAEFLPTAELIAEKERHYNKDSDEFFRFVFGFWKSTATSNTVVTTQLLTLYKTRDTVEWSGKYPRQTVAGLDPSFSAGGDGCVLRLAHLGVDIRGKVVLDFKDEQLMFHLLISAQSKDPVEIQIAKQVNEIMNKYHVPIRNLVVDSNGQGRALGEVIRLQMQSLISPLKVFSSHMNNIMTKSFDIYIVPPYELWYNFRAFILEEQVKGLDLTTASQLSTRLVVQGESGKMSMEKKHDYKSRMGGIMPSLAHSPDEADAAALCLYSAIMNFNFTPGQTKEVEMQGDFGTEKYKAFLEGRAVEEKHNSEIVMPEAAFTGGMELLADYKPPFT